MPEKEQISQADIHQDSIGRLLNEKHRVNKLKLTSSEKSFFEVWTDTERSKLAFRQSTVEADMHQVSREELVGGKIHYLDLKRQNLGWQAFLDGYTGNFQKKYNFNGDSGMTFGLSDILLEAQTNGQTQELKKVTSHIADLDRDEEINTALAGLSFEYKDRYSLNVASLLMLSPFSDKKPSEIVINPREVISSLEYFQTLFDDDSLQDVSWVVSLKEEFKSVMDGKFVSGIKALAADESEKKEISEKAAALHDDSYFSRSEMVDVMRKVTAVVSLSRHQKMIGKILPSQSEIIGGNTIKFTNARSPLRTMQYANHVLRNGKFDAQGKPIGIKDAWYVSDYFRKEEVGQAIATASEHDKPISIEISKDKPIILITAPNGSGKTAAIRTTTQNLWQLSTLGEAPYAKNAQAGELNPPVCIINASVDSPYASTFESEMEQIIKRIMVTDGDAQRTTVKLFDELARGTDSTEAAALICAIAEQTIKNGEYLVFATHGADEVLELARKTGLANKIMVLSVDPETRALHEVNEAVKSEGIEMMESMSEESSLQFKWMMDTARKIREAVMSGETPNIENMPAIEMDERAIPFANRATLEALHLSYETGLNQVFLGLLAMVRSQSEADALVDHHFLSHLEKSLSFEESAISKDLQIIAAIEEVSKSPRGQELGGISGLYELTAKLLNIYSDLTTFQLDEDRRERIEEFLDQGEVFYNRKEPSFYKEKEYVDAFLDQFSLASIVRKLIYYGSDFEKLDRILFKSSFFRTENRKTVPYEIALKYRDVLFNAEQKENDLLKNDVMTNLLKGLVESYGWKEKHLQELKDLGISSPMGMTNDGEIRDWFVNLIDVGDENNREIALKWLFKAYVDGGLPSGAKRKMEGSHLDSLIELVKLAGDNKESLQTHLSYSADEVARDYFANKLLHDSLESMAKGNFITPSLRLSRAIRISKINNSSRYKTEKVLKQLHKLDHQILIEWDKAKHDIQPEINIHQAYLDNILYAIVFARAAEILEIKDLSEADEQEFSIKNVVPLALLSQKPISELQAQEFTISPETNIVAVGGYNGNGKSHFAKSIATLAVLKKLSGKLFATGKIPNYSHVRALINTGMSTENHSSFQNEAQANTKLVNELVDNGLPRNGLYIVDEPFATTSGEDQIGLSCAEDALLTSHGGQVIKVTHNRQIYPQLRHMKDKGLATKFQFFGFPYDPSSPFHLQEFDESKAETVKSGGIQKAEDMGLDPRIIKVANYYMSLSD